MASKRRAGGRSGNTRRTGSLVPNQMPWKQPLNWDRPTEPLGEEGILNIHNGCMRILKEIGIEFLNPESLEIFKKAGCKVTDTNVRMDEDFVLEMLKKAPTQFTITPRNDAKKIVAKTLITTIGRDIFSKSSENFSDGWSATAIPSAEAADV